MNDFIDAAHKMYEVSTSDMFTIMIVSFIGGSFITDTFGCIVRFFIKK